MVSARRARGYVGGHAGAPPVPPPGGYRGERRFPDHPILGGLVADPSPVRSHPPAHPLGWVALLASLLFAGLLVAVLVSGEAGLAFGTTMLAMQAVVVGLIAAAFCVRRARILGAVALTIALLINVGTAGAVGALLGGTATDSGGSESTAEQLAYPGIEGLDPGAVLAAPSLEDVEDHTAQLSQRIRERLTDELGYTWTRITDPDLRPERNGYGGESLLQQYTSPRWRTDQPIRDPAEKRRALAAVNAVLVESGQYYELYALNEPDGTIDPRALESLYGSADPQKQAIWEHATQRYGRGGFDGPSPTLFYATVTDLGNDPDGRFRAREEAERAAGEPLEGLTIMFLAPELLAESDRAAFEEGTR